jgi:hypothetical protein
VWDAQPGADRGGWTDPWTDPWPDPWAHRPDPAGESVGDHRDDRRDGARPDPAADADDRAGAARADALVAMAEAYLSSAAVPTTNPDNYQVVIHDQNGLLDDGDGRCHIERGPTLAADTVRRLLCGASMLWLAEDADGKPVAVSDRTHDIPISVRRAVRARDKGCVFPNGNGGRCGLAAEHSHVHHVTHRAHGGAHTATNCRVLCSFHHHLVHEGGFTMTLDAQGTLEVRRPDGTLLPSEPNTATGPTDRPRQLWSIPPDLDPNGGWARSNGERMDLAAAVDAVIEIKKKELPGTAA